jgi:hypothetical protein
MPDGAIRINPAFIQLSKEGHVTWFVDDATTSRTHGLIQYGSEEIDNTKSVINPARRDLEKQIPRLPTQLRRHQANLGAAAPSDPDNPKAIEHRATLPEANFHHPETDHRFIYQLA